MRVLLTGGGTAGHINPALAIAEIIRCNDPTAVIEFVGIKTGKENDLVPREGYRLHYVESMGIQRSLSLSNLKALWLAVTSPYAKATVRILKEFQPDLVIGTGGYACWPLMAAAARLGIPTAVHESNALPGLAVRRLQKRVDRIWINFEATRSLLQVQERVVRVGNPLRAAFGRQSYEAARKQLRIGAEQKLILSFGGSLGAEGVNRAALKVMRQLVAGKPSLLQIHATGKRDFEGARAHFTELGLDAFDNCRLVDYIYDMPVYMAAADIVICRAGAMTLSELAQMKKACILIPSPHVADNHQYKNAKALADAGAAVLVEESALENDSLPDAVQRLLSSRGLCAELSDSIAAFADINANRTIWEEIVSLVGSHQNEKGK